MSSGGDINDMAKDGTTIPGDAGKQNIIPSKAPSDADQPTAGGLGKSELHHAADNPSSVSGGVGEGVTGIGDTLPESATSKPFGKGHGGKDDK